MRYLTNTNVNRIISCDHCTPLTMSHKQTLEKLYLFSFTYSLEKGYSMTYIFVVGDMTQCINNTVDIFLKALND